MTSDKAKTNENSALWAAWADALGFVSELVDQQWLMRRTNGRALTEPIAWERRVGGRGGIKATLPAGCYSDDTQLRLATGRAISDDGFDVEAFARVELPVWPAYALGGGRASKAAAVSMSRPQTAWFANFYEGWTESGGNGAAMRIQPHVWAAADHAPGCQADTDVFLNAITTHGHPRAIYGAVLHARTLARTITTGHIPIAEDWGDLLDETTAVLDTALQQHQLQAVWIPRWEADTGTPFADAWLQTAHECSDFMDSITEQGASASTAENRYRNLTEKWSLTLDTNRGSGTLTALAALALAHWVGPDPARAATVSANAIGTDTDTIATMAAAICGAHRDAPEPPSTLMDRDYLKSEAHRFARIAVGSPTPRFPYPDLLTWVPPRTQSDAYGLADGQQALAGIGWCEPTHTLPTTGTGVAWDWVRSTTGQTFLVKHRRKLPELAPPNWPAPQPATNVHTDDATPTQPLLPGMHGAGDLPAAPNEEPSSQDPTPRPDSNPTSDNRPDTSTGPAPDTNNNPETIRDTRSPQNPTPQSHQHDRTDPPKPTRNNTRNTPQDQFTERRGIDIDSVLEWVQKNDHTDAALGYAVRRVAQIGTYEQLIALTVALRNELTHPKTPRDTTTTPTDTTNTP